MKLSELFESTELRDVDKDQSKWIDYNQFGQPMTIISVETLSRKYDVLEDLVISGLTNEHFKVALAKSKIMAGVFKMVKHPDTNELGLAIICLVYFKHPIIENPPNDMVGLMLQVDRVATVPAYEAMYIATRLYSTLVNAGYVVVSDTVQYRGGMKLWKKIARHTVTGDYNVHIFDRKLNDYLKDDNNQILTYNGSNLPDTAIWLTGKPGQQFILIAKS